jgi:transposase
VHRYVRRSKTDRADAKALLEAARNDEIHPVPVKTVSQQALTTLHRIRSTWQATRIMRLNSLRGLLREFGVTIPAGAHHVVPRVRALLEDPEAPVPMSVRPSLAVLCDEVRRLEDQIDDLERQLAQLAKQLPLVAHLRTIPGVGLLTATALVACVGDVRRFPSGRATALSARALAPRNAPRDTIVHTWRTAASTLEEWHTGRTGVGTHR